MKKEFNLDPYKVLKSLVEVTASHTGKKFLRIICNELRRVFEANLVFITKPLDHNPTTKVNILYSTDKSLPNSFELEGSPCKLVYDDNKIIQIKEAANQCFEGTKGTDFESFYGIPLNNKRNRCIGHIAMFSKNKRIISKEVEDIILIFSRRIETEYERNILEEENKKITKRLEKMTTTDSLTNLYNRRYFDNFSEETLSRVQRIPCDVTISFIDIDDFKKLNDTYGHKTGDDVLIYLSKILIKNSRKGIDYIFRIGGEEFAIISVNSTIQKSINYLKRINKQLEESPFDLSKNIQITLSIGVDSFKSEDKLFEDIYHRGDQKRYTAKNNGKNLIVK